MADKVVSYGTAKVGQWEKIPTAWWETEGLVPNIVYQFNYRAPELVWYKPWTIFYLWFDPEAYVLKVREEIAKELGVSTNAVQIRWFYYDADTRELKFQFRYTRILEIREPAVAFVLPSLWAISFLIITITGSFVAFKSLFTGNPVLEEILKFAEEGAEEARKWMEKFGQALKYVAWIVVPVVGIYGAVKLAPLFKKKRA